MSRIIPIELFSYLFFVMTTVAGYPGILFGQTSKTLVSGEVRNENGSQLEFVNVQIVGSPDGDMTNAKGRFHFTTSLSGPQEIRFSLLGFESSTVSARLSTNDSTFVSVVLSEKLIDFKEVVVTGSAYSTGDELKGTTLRSLDVLTTPGSAADIFRAVQTFPGVISVDEGSGLFVRGGDVSETVILLDQATLLHPYKFESPTGGFFGTIPPFLIGGTYFSTGGFSARYGDALSGVLAMESLNLPKRQSWSLGLGLAAGSVGASIPIIDNLGIRFSANKSLTNLMFRLNGVHNQFTVMPSGEDANVSIVYTYSKTGQLKLFNFYNSDRLGVRVDEPSFKGVYASNETGWLHNLQWSDAVGEWFGKASLSYSRFETDRHLGNLSLQPSDGSYKLRADFDRFVSEDLHISAGLEAERVQNNFQGTIPTNPSVLDPEADVYLLDDRIEMTHAGSYVEMEKRLGTHLTGSAGVRADYHDLGSQAVVDPRISMRYDFTKETNARLSWGIYHQNPQPILFDPKSGSPNLHSQSAQHIVATLDHTVNLFMIRVEGYHKSYDHLVIESKQDHYINGGYGYADGVDLFIKYGGFLLTPFSGWFSYSYLHSRRLQARDLVDRYLYEVVPSPYDITHNFTIVGKLQLIQFLSAGLTFRFATGRPVTPVVGAEYQATGQYYIPIEGPVNSERYPNFARLDGALSYFLPYGEANSVTFYLAVANMLNRPNPVRYEYSPDYSQRTLRTTDFPRSVYFGFALSIGSIGGDF
jgi:vitamin B12 transporter